MIEKDTDEPWDLTGPQQSRKERRIAISKTFLRYVTPFAICWFFIASYLDAPRLEIAALISTVGFLAAAVFHGLNWHTTARVTSLVASNVAIFLAAMVVHPFGYISFILLAAAGIPFLVFSIRKRLPLVLVLVGLPILLWFAGWWTEYSLLGPYDIGEDVAKYVIAPLAAVTIFGVVLFEFAYFVTATSRYAHDLSKARQRAEVANEAKSALLRSMSHEMRTPLNAIVGFGELVRERADSDVPLDSEMVKERMDIILSASNDLLLMIENMLTYASIVGSEIQVNKTVVDLGEKFANVMRRYGHLVSAKNLEFDLLLPNGIKVLADPMLLFATIMHLLDNATKYTPSGGQITVTSEYLPDDRVKLIFQDTGPGFSKEAAQRAFDPFERLGFTNGVHPGAGIGLALVQSYVAAMGGEVGIDTENPSGAAVWFTLGAA